MIGAESPVLLSDYSLANIATDMSEACQLDDYETVDLTEAASHANLGVSEGAEQNTGQLAAYRACWIIRRANVSFFSDCSQSRKQGKSYEN